jgi:hypothetical protein
MSTPTKPTPSQPPMPTEPPTPGDPPNPTHPIGDPDVPAEPLQAPRREPREEPVIEPERDPTRPVKRPSRPTPIVPETTEVPDRPHVPELDPMKG